MKFIINKKEKSKIPSTKLYDLGSVTTDINDLLNTSIINIGQNTIPVLIIDGLNYLINNFNPNDYKEDFEILLTESDLISFGDGGSSDEFIPLTGTQVGSPVTGGIEFNEFNNSMYIKGANYPDDTYGISFTEGGISIGHNDTVLGFDSRTDFTSEGLIVKSTNLVSKGISSTTDFTTNITDLDYTQKKYVDERGAVSNATKVVLSASDLNTAYPNAKDGFRVFARDIIAGGMLYHKIGASWVSQAITLVV